MNITRDDAVFRRRGAVRSAVLATGLVLGAALPVGAAEGVASFYGGREHGGPTASGERFNMHALTAAHRTAPLGSHLRVTNLRNGRSVVVRINDRGPFVKGRIIDLSRAAAEKLGFVASGLTRVSVEKADATAASEEPTTTASLPAAKPAGEKQAAAKTSGHDAEVKVALEERDRFLADRGVDRN